MNQLMKLCEQAARGWGSLERRIPGMGDWSVPLVCPSPRVWVH